MDVDTKQDSARVTMDEQQLIDLPKFNEDNIIELIDQITSTEASKLNEQLKELEVLEKAKIQIDQTQQKKRQQQTSHLDLEYETDSNLIIKNLITDCNDEFEKEWQSVFGGSVKANSNVSMLSTSFDQINLSNNTSAIELNKFSPSQLLLSKKTLQNSPQVSNVKDKPHESSNKKVSICHYGK